MFVYLFIIVLRFAFFAFLLFVHIFTFFAVHILYIPPRAIADAKIYKYISIIFLLYIVERRLGYIFNIYALALRWYILYVIFASFMFFVFTRILRVVDKRRNNSFKK